MNQRNSKQIFFTFLRTTSLAILMTAGIFRSARGGSDPLILLSGNLCGLIMPEFETRELTLERGFTTGFGGTLGIRLISPLYLTSSVTYVQHRGTEFQYTTVQLGSGFLWHREEIQRQLQELRVDLGILLRTQTKIDSSVGFQLEFGATYFDPSLEQAPRWTSYDPYWGGYGGAGIEYELTSIASTCAAIKYRYLQNKVLDFTGFQFEFSLRLKLPTQ